MFRYGTITHYDEVSWRETMETNKPRAIYIFKIACETKLEMQNINEGFKLLDQMSANGERMERTLKRLHTKLGCKDVSEAKKILNCWMLERRKQNGI